jgi:hypothetical protein
LNKKYSCAAGDLTNRDENNKAKLEEKVGKESDFEGFHHMKPCPLLIVPRQTDMDMELDPDISLPVAERYLTRNMATKTNAAV